MNHKKLIIRVELEIHRHEEITPSPNDVYFKIVNTEYPTG